MTEREGEVAGHLYCNTPKCIVTGTVHCFSHCLDTVHKIFSKKKMK